MIVFAVRRMLVSVPTLLASSFLVFVLVAKAGDPLANLAQNPQTPAGVIAARRAQLGLDQPLPVRYWHWLGGVVRGDFGPSVNGLDIRADLSRRLLVTLRMVVLAMAVALVLAVVIGVLSAVKQYSGIDYCFTFTGFLFLSMPAFWLAALLKEYVAIRVNQLTGRQILFTVGDSTPGLSGNFLERLPNYLGHLVLPTITLALLFSAGWARFQRSAMLDVLHSDYIRLARAKGLSSRRVMVRHGLRTALIPLTTVVALNVGDILGGAIITERVFAWHGMGEMLLEGVNDSDVNVVLAWLTVSAVLIVVFNLVADLLYAVLDPRIRLS